MVAEESKAKQFVEKVAERQNPKVCPIRELSETIKCGTMKDYGYAAVATVCIGAQCAFWSRTDNGCGLKLMR